jgi:hypothetical protein
MACGLEISSYVATTKLFWMDWEPQRIPDPTTNGDFTRCFDQNSVLALMEAINAIRQRIWKEQPRVFQRRRSSKRR